MSSRKTDTYYWRYKLKIKFDGEFALPVQTIKKALEGKRLQEVFVAAGWLAGDDIVFDLAKNMKGFLKQTASDVFGATSVKTDRITNALFVRTPAGRMTCIGKLEDVKGDENQSNKDVLAIGKQQFKDYPYLDFVRPPGKAQPVKAMHYRIDVTGMEIEFIITSWGKDVYPDEPIKSLLDRMGGDRGLSPRYNQGFGTFKVIEWKELEYDKIA